MGETRWSTKVHKVVDQLENGTYVVEPADGHGNTRIMNRAELQLCPPSVLQKTPVKARRQRVLVAPRYPPSSDDDSHPGVPIDLAPPPVDVKPDDTADVSNSDSDESIADEPEADDELPVRHSTRSNAGHHSNQYQSPMSILTH